MKRVVIVIAIVGFYGTVGAGPGDHSCLMSTHARYCNPPPPEIADSHHDFSDASWANHETCRPCHIPHDANQTVIDSPLWSHEVTTASYTVYSSATMDASPGQPSGRSKLCLSCHDGTVAIENHAGSTGGTYFPGFGNMSTDLSDDHPISFAYTSSLASADGGLKDPSTTASGLGGTIAEDMLENGMMECTSCHDVHIARNTQGCLGCHFVAPGVSTRTLSLRKSNLDSGLCLTCHDK